MRTFLSLLLLTTLAIAPSAHAAGVPSPANSLVPTVITLVGHDGFGHPDPAGTFFCVIRDLANDPRPGVQVVVDFSTAPGLRVCTQQAQAGVSVDCATGAPRVSAITDATGRVTFAIMGCANLGAATPTDRVGIYADGVLQGMVIPAAADLDGCNGVGSADLSLWIEDFGSNRDWSRGDYDGSGTLGAADFSVWLTLYGTGRSAASCSSLASSTCP